MNRREIIKGVLQGERSKRLPRALFGGGLWSYKQTGLKPVDLVHSPRKFAETLAGLFRTLDTDIVFPGSGLNTFPAEAIGGELSFAGGRTPLLSQPVIQKTADALHFTSIDIADSPHTLALVEMIRHLRKSLPDRFLCVTSWGPFAWGMILCEREFLREQTVLDRNFVREICELGVRLSAALFEPLIEQGLVDGVVFSDGAATLIPLDLYREVVLPSERGLFERVGKPGVGLFLHQCGAISPQIPLYPETGAHCITLDAGIPIGKVYEQYRDRVATAGNVDVTNKIFKGDIATIRKEVSDTVSRISDPFQKYILMPSCDLPPDTPLRNVQEFLAGADLVSS